MNLERFKIFGEIVKTLIACTASFSSVARMCSIFKYMGRMESTKPKDQELTFTFTFIADKTQYNMHY